MAKLVIVTDNRS